VFLERESFEWHRMLKQLMLFWSAKISHRETWLQAMTLQKIFEKGNTKKDFTFFLFLLFPLVFLFLCYSYHKHSLEPKNVLINELLLKVESICIQISRNDLIQIIGSTFHHERLQFSIRYFSIVWWFSQKLHF